MPEGNLLHRHQEYSKPPCCFLAVLFGGGHQITPPQDRTLFAKFARHIGYLSSHSRAKRHFAAYPPIFIIGAARSGTTLLFNILKSQPAVTPLFEPHNIWSRVLGPGKDDSYPCGLSGVNKCFLRGNFFRSIQPGKPKLVVKDPRDSLRVSHLKTLFPGARFIFLSRDGRDVVASMVKTSRLTLYNNFEGWLHVRIPGYKKIIW